MSFLQNAMQSLFGGAPTAQQVPQNVPPGSQGGPQGNQPGDPNLGTQQSANTAPNGVVPKTEEEPAPFAGFEKLWETPAVDPNKPDPNAPVFAGLDQEQLMKAAGSIDFTKVATQEDLAKIQAGGQDAMVTMMQVMNKVAQGVYGNSALATTKIVEHALAKQSKQFEAQLPNLVKRLSANDNLLTENPLLANPALAPLVSALQSQLTLKNPSATTSEITKQVNEYFSALGKEFGPKSTKKAEGTSGEGKGSGGEDWSKWA